MKEKAKRAWKTGGQAGLALFLLAVVIGGMSGHPVFAARVFCYLCLFLGAARCLDRDPESWMAVRRWWLDASVLFALGVAFWWLAPYAGVLMPFTD